MTKRIILSFVLVAFIAALFTVPAFASSIRSSSESSFRYSGDVRHEREFDFRGFAGRSRFLVEGFGEAQGSQDTLTKIASGRSGVNIDSSFNVATDPRAGFDDQMRLSSAVQLNSGGSSVQAFTGIKPYPGETGYQRQTAAGGAVYGGSGYLNYDNQFGTTGGVTVRDLLIDDRGVSGAYIKEEMRVEGYAEVWESMSVSGSDTKTGWWDINSQ